MKIGIIGCGNISQAYFNASKTFNMLEVVACADIHHAVAEAKAAEYGIKALSVEELLSDPDIGLIINLTIPAAHAEITLRSLKSGKHVYGEKPLAVTREEGKEILALAQSTGLRVGCAPDTFLGAGLQTTRKILDDGWIGRPVAATAFMLGYGPEGWHPNPGFFYQKGAGPMFDMGPYYITALVSLLGPVKQIAAMARSTFPERIAGHKDLRGKKIPVEVPTHYSGTLEFHNGTIVTMAVSFDIWNHTHLPIELYGSLGSMSVPDPNTFGGDILLRKPGMTEWKQSMLTHGYADNMRSIGAADMVRSIEKGVPHRCSLELAYHVLDVMHSFEESSTSGKTLTIQSRCERPAPLPLGLAHGQLD